MKNQIIKIDTKKTITIKDYLLEILAQKKYEDTYENQKEKVNSFIRQIVKSEDFNSMETTKYITEYCLSNDEVVQELRAKIERLEEQKIELENSYFLLKKATK